ncbi:MAG: ABC transporter permease [Methanobacteriaceae archaeon]|jgi:multidrug/hemolysin transport system permease protein|nr:ABC transporter permease [Candidatus Methanorudis spinitermitis]
MLNLIIRNLKIFFRDRTAVFLSLLGVFIIFGLYILFLGEVTAESVSNLENGRFLIDSWLVAGLLGVTSLTTTLSAFGIIVSDRTNNIMKDFKSSPLSHKSLVGSYVLSSFLVGMIMTIITLIIGELYIFINGGTFLPLFSLIKVLGIIILSVLASSAIVFLIVSFLNTLSSFSTASILIGTLSGFITAIYVPMGILPSSIQFLVKLFLISYAASLFRQIFMEVPTDKVFQNASASQVVEFNKEMGVKIFFGSHYVTPLECIIILLVTIFIFYLLGLLIFSRKKK